MKDVAIRSIDAQISYYQSELNKESKFHFDRPREEKLKNIIFGLREARIAVVNS